MIIRRFVAPALAAALLFQTFAWAQDPPNRRVSVRRGELYRGMNPTQLIALPAPDIANRGLSGDEMARMFIEVSDVGGTGFWFDLAGYNEDGTVLDPENVQAIKKMKEEARYRYIVPVMRLFGPDAPEEASFRENLVKAAAEIFKEDTAMIYWIDGPNSDALAEMFADIAPQPVVASPRNGDLQVVRDERFENERTPTLLIDHLPEPVGSDTHVLLTSAEDAYAMVDKATRYPAEKSDFEPTTIGLSEEEKAEGFVSLFNGRSLDGWSISGDNKDGWAIEDGELLWQSRGGGVVMSHKRYDDFVLRLEWKLFKEGANSGLFLRAPRANRQSKMGFEFQMMGDYGQPVHDDTTGAIYSVLAPKVNASKPVGEWNELEIRLDGPHYRAILNGQVVQDINFDEHPEMKNRLRRGFIGLQDHSNKVAFRNIRIKEL